jgi:hypothetical protein
MNIYKDQCPQLVSSTLCQSVGLKNEASKEGVFRQAAQHRWNQAGDVMPLFRSLKHRYSNFKHAFAGLKHLPAMIMAM